MERHLRSLRKVFAKVSLIYWEKDPREPLYTLEAIEVTRVVLPFGAGGAGFYLRLMAGFFLRLWRARPKHVEAVDPEGLIPARLLDWFFPARITYFSMEYYSELPSLRAKPFKRRVWKALERWGASRVAAAATVCDSIAEHLSRDFAMPVLTVRNVPERAPYLKAAARDPSASTLALRCGLSPEAPIAIYQGMLQEGRGLEATVAAIALLPEIHFALVGPGPLRKPLAEMAERLGCAARVHFLGETPFADMIALTRGAFAGLAPFQPLSTSYVYSLPGKLFEYAQAGLPVVSFALPEMRKVIEGYGIGICLAESTPRALADALARLLSESRDPKSRTALATRLERAQRELCWEAEEAKYLELYRGIR